MFVEFYIFAAIGSILFSEISPMHWGNVGLAMLTLFQTATLEGWPDLMYQSLEVQRFSWIFFVVFIIVNSLVLMNMIVGVIIDVMIRRNSAGQTDELKSLLGLHNKMDTFEKKFVNNQYIDQNTFDKVDNEINSNNDTKITVGIIIERKEKILLLQRPNGTWAIPKGHVKEGESNYEGMVRELKEETQIELPSKADYLHETTNKTGSVLHIYIYSSTESLKPIINSEHIGWAYFSKDALPENIDFGLNKYLSKKE